MPIAAITIRSLGATASFLPNALPGTISGAPSVRLDVARNLRRVIRFILIVLFFGDLSSA
jgi:hypothetical protein